MRHPLGPIAWLLCTTTGCGGASFVAASRTTAEILVGDAVIGVDVREEGRVGDTRAIAHHRRYRFRSGEHEVTRDVRTLALVDDAGRLDRAEVTEDGAARIVDPDGAPVLLDAWAPGFRALIAGGDPVRADTIDLATGAVEAQDLAVVGPADGGTVVAATSAGRARGRYVVDEGGDIVGMHLGAFTWRRAADAALPDEPADLLAAVRIASPPPPGGPGRWTFTATVRPEGLVPERPPLQTVAGDRVTVRVPLEAELPRADREQLRRLVADVGAALERRPVPGPATPAAVLSARAGDCNEHALRFATLATDAGYDARVVAGVAWLDGDVPAGFYPHAWVEVRVGDTLVPVDPVLGRVVADAARIRLVDDGPEAPWRLIEALEHLTIDAATAD